MIKEMILQKIMKQNLEYMKIVNFLNNFDKIIFARMTGSGSCIYGAFQKQEEALNA